MQHTQKQSQTSTHFLTLKNYHSLFAGKLTAYIIQATMVSYIVNVAKCLLTN